MFNFHLRRVRTFRYFGTASDINIINKYAKNYLEMSDETNKARQIIKRPFLFVNWKYDDDNNKYEPVTTLIEKEKKMKMKKMSILDIVMSCTMIGFSLTMYYYFANRRLISSKH